MTAVLEGGEWSAARPGRTLPPGKNRYPFYRRLGVPQGRSGRAENLVPTGIRSRTVQPVAQSLYRLSYPAHNINWWNFRTETGGVYCAVRTESLVVIQDGLIFLKELIKSRNFDSLMLRTSFIACLKI